MLRTLHIHFQGKHDILRPAFGKLTAPVIDDSTYDSMLHFATEITNKVGSVGFWRNLNASLASSAGPALITQIVLPASIVQENVDFIKNELRFRERYNGMINFSYFINP